MEEMHSIGARTTQLITYKMLNNGNVVKVGVDSETKVLIIAQLLFHFNWDLGGINSIH